MTFPEALRELARLRPRIVPWLSYWFEFVSHDVRVERYQYFPENFAAFLLEFTQDKIDSILAELGWEYWVIPENAFGYSTDERGKIIRWHAEVRKYDDSDGFIIRCRKPDKLSAARATLITVVEELKEDKEEGETRR